MSGDHLDRDEIERYKPMPSPAPLLRPPVPGAGRLNSGTRIPRLGLAIPPSPSQKPVIGNSSVPEIQPVHRPSTRPALPQLRLATPKGSNTTPQDGALPLSGRTPSLPYGGNSASGASDTSAHSRSDSFTMNDERFSGPGSEASSAYSAVSFANGQRHPSGTPDPASAISSAYSDRGIHEGGLLMERNGSNNALPDLEKLSLEKGRPLDVEDLDDDGWRAASEAKKIIEIGTLGEGAGGAVTKCMLKGGKTVFALKVGLKPLQRCLFSKRSRLSRPIQTQMSKSRYFENLLLTRDVLRNIYVDIMARSIRAVPHQSQWSTVKVAVLTPSIEKSRSLVGGLVKRSWGRWQRVYLTV